MEKETREQYHSHIPEGTRAMILAAGLGTRLKPWTDHHPKALALVSGKSLLQRNIEYLQQYGIRDVVVNVHHFAEQVIQAIEMHNGWGSRISISDETDAVLETGGGLVKASWFFTTGDFVLMNADVLTDMNLANMFTFHRRYKPLATIAVRQRETSRYFLFDSNDDLCGWRNVKTGEEKISRVTKEPVQRAFSGIHIISPSVFARIHQNGKFSMVDVYLELAKTETIKGFDHSSSAFFDVGKPESQINAAQFFDDLSGRTK